MIGVVLFVLNCVSFSFQNILTLRFLIGLILGVLLSTVPVFISEVNYNYYNNIHNKNYNYKRYQLKMSEGEMLDLYLYR